MFEELRFMLMLDWNAITDSCYCENCVSPEERLEAEVLVMETVDAMLPQAVFS
jgi:hypothetical protein